jgi:tetratricopeptide (TPR) repeat protein
LYLLQARDPEARAELDASQAFGPIVGRDRFLQALGSISVNQSEFDRAVAAYARRIEVNPNSAEAHRQLAEIYFLQGRDVDALAEYVASAFVEPSDPRAFAGVGQVLLRVKRYAEAAAALSRAVSLGGGDAPTRYALGMALTRVGREEEGQAQLDWSRRLQAGAIAAGQREFQLQVRRREGERQLASGNHAEALATLEPLIDPQALGPSAELHRDLATAYAATGKAEEASRHRAAAEQLEREARLRRMRELVGSL